jgi:hypothetical protein
MARKFGTINKMSEKFEDYSYIINGVGGIGKTTLVYEIGKIVTGSDEGTFIITCGGENKPKHIPGAFGDVAPDFKTFCAIVKELCDNNGGEIEALGTICMKTADNKILTGWLASQTDILSEDWLLIADESLLTNEEIERLRKETINDIEE